MSRPRKAKPVVPPTESEISLTSIAALVGISQSLSRIAAPFLDTVGALAEIYSEEAIDRLIIEPLTVASEINKIKIAKNQTLEEVVASNPTLKDLWLGEIYADSSEDQAVERLTTDLKKLMEAIKTKSFKTYLKDRSTEATKEGVDDTAVDMH